MSGDRDGSLRRVGDSSALPELVERLNDPDPRVRLAALDAVGSLGTGTESRSGPAAPPATRIRWSERVPPGCS